MSHTPAPWVVVPEGCANKPDYFNGVLRIKSTAVDETIIDINTNMGFIANKGDKGFANARLIAAAPDLLKVVKQFLDIAEYLGGKNPAAYKDCKTNAKWAIRKVEGK